jgi:hypothetical protein
MLDAHDPGPDAVLALVPELGGRLGRVVVVGCEPATLRPGMELSAPVAAAVGPAAQLVIDAVLTAHASPVNSASLRTAAPAFLSDDRLRGFDAYRRYRRRSAGSVTAPDW